MITMEVSTPRSYRPPRIVVRTLLCPAIVALTACGGSAAAGVLATRADSAGIQVVTNSGPAWPVGGGWQIQPEPILQISAREDDDPHYDLFSVRGARFLPTGEILVLVAGHRELRIYGADGTWVRTIGRDGDRPGKCGHPVVYSYPGIPSLSSTTSSHGSPPSAPEAPPGSLGVPNPGGDRKDPAGPAPGRRSVDRLGWDPVRQRRNAGYGALPPARHLLALSGPLAPHCRHHPHNPGDRAAPHHHHRSRW